MMARAPVLFFSLELPDANVYKRSMGFVDFNFTFLFYSLVHVPTLINGLYSVIPRCLLLNDSKML